MDKTLEQKLDEWLWLPPEEQKKYNPFVEYWEQMHRNLPDVPQVEM